MRDLLIRTIVAAFLLGLLPAQGSAQEIKSKAFDPARFNKGRVTIITGGLEYVHNTYLRLAGEMASVLNREGELRLLPMMGGGPVDNVRDLLFLEGVDVGVVHSDVLTFLKNHDSLPAAQRKLKYIAKLYDEYFHIVANKDIKSVIDLDGRKVVVGSTASAGSTVSAVTLFELLGIEPDYQLGDWKGAVQKIKRGEAAAMVYSTVRGSKFVREIEAEESLKLLPLPYTDELSGTYSRAEFTDADYPNLVPPGRAISTLQFGAIMAVYDWKPSSERYKSVATFTTNLFDKVEALQGPPYHERWKTFAPAAEVRGWTRFGPAQDWLDRRREAARRFAVAKEAAQTLRLGADAAALKALEAAVTGGDDLRDTQIYKAFADYMRRSGGMAEASEQELLELFLSFTAWRAEGSGTDAN